MIEDRLILAILQARGYCSVPGYDDYEQWNLEAYLGRLVLANVDLMINALRASAVAGKAMTAKVEFAAVNSLFHGIVVHVSDDDLQRFIKFGVKSGDYVTFATSPEGEENK